MFFASDEMTLALMNQNDASIAESQSWKRRRVLSILYIVLLVITLPCVFILLVNWVNDVRYQAVTSPLRGDDPDPLAGWLVEQNVKSIAWQSCGSSFLTAFKFLKCVSCRLANHRHSCPDSRHSGLPTAVCWTVTQNPDKTRNSLGLRCGLGQSGSGLQNSLCPHK